MSIPGWSAADAMTGAVLGFGGGLLVGFVLGWIA
jgi:hypothetical protein